MPNLKPEIFPPKDRLAFARAKRAGPCLSGRQSPLAENTGFTLIELLVVLSVMVILATVLTLNLSGQRAARDIKLAQNQLITDIRKIQSYTFSARTLPSGQSVQYYALKLDLNKPGQYTVQAIFDASSEPKLIDLETINLPSKIQMAAVSPANPVSIARSLSPTIQPIDTACALAVFAAPFGKIIFNDGCVPTASSADPVNLSPSDDYYANVINFLSNTSCPSYPPPVDFLTCKASTDSIMTISLSDAAGTVSKKILINGITGTVCPTETGLACLTSN